MKLSTSIKQAGTTLAEMMIGLSVSSVIAAAAITASVGLQKSFNAVDQFFATQMQQVRIIDYLARDVNRGLAVTTPGGGIWRSADRLPRPALEELDLRRWSIEGGVRIANSRMLKAPDGIAAGVRVLNETAVQGFKRGNTAAKIAP